MGTITIVLADDHPIVRQGLRALLDREPDCSVMGEATDGHTALALVERLKPSVLIVDLKMPGLDGLEVTRRVSSQSPHTRVLVLSMYANAAYVTEALQHGAAGYVLKDTDTINLVRAVRTVAAGERYLSPSISDLVIEAYLQKTKGGSSDPYETLTPRERLILRLIAEGHPNAEIAAELAISPRTVETHRAHMMQKLGLKTRTELVRYGLRREIVPRGNF